MNESPHCKGHTVFQPTCGCCRAARVNEGLPKYPEGYKRRENNMNDGPVQMNLDLKISAEQINQYVAQQVLDSALGAQIRKFIEDKVKDLSRTYNNPLEKEVERVIGVLIHKVVEEEYTDQIKGHIRSLLTEAAVGEMIDKLWKHFQAKYWE